MRKGEGGRSARPFGNQPHHMGKAYDLLVGMLKFREGGRGSTGLWQSSEVLNKKSLTKFDGGKGPNGGAEGPNRGTKPRNQNSDR